MGPSVRWSIGPWVRGSMGPAFLKYHGNGDLRVIKHQETHRIAFLVEIQESSRKFSKIQQNLRKFSNLLDASLFESNLFLIFLSRLRLGSPVIISFTPRHLYQTRRLINDFCFKKPLPIWCLWMTGSEMCYRKRDGREEDRMDKQMDGQADGDGQG